MKYSKIYEYITEEYFFFHREDLPLLRLYKQIGIEDNILNELEKLCIL